MRRFTLASAAAAVALTIVIPVGAQAGTDVVRDRAHDREVLKLDCGVRTTDSGPAVGCEWSKPTSPRAVGVRLLRLDPSTDPHRKVIFRTRDLDVTTFTDTNVRPEHRYVYAVQAIGARGRVVGQSRPVWVSVPGDHQVEVLRLKCALGSAHEAIGCEWSRPESRDAYVVSLWRSVDGGERELVEQFRPSGPNAYRDPVPAGASRVTYAVIATSESDRIVARSRPKTVVIPDVADVEVLRLKCALGSAHEAIGCEWSRPESRDAYVVSLWRSVDGGERELVEQFRPSGPNAYRDPVPAGASQVTYAVIATSESDRIVARSRPETVVIPDIRPVDTRPVDTRPVDTRPVDTRPVDTQPVDTQPVDTQPVDTAPRRERAAP